MRVALLIPVLNEAEALPVVLAELPRDLRVVVCDNGSTDGTPELARAAGAEVVHHPRRGYGGAVLAGIRHLAADPPDVVVVYDGDHSCDPADLPALLGPIREGRADFVLGDRTERAEPGSLTRTQVWGNALAVRLIALHTGHRYREMGPLRAIRYEALVGLGMTDPTWGWNVEMQMKAVAAGLRIMEIPVASRARIGTSKISGSVRGSLRAGYRIVWATWRYRSS